MSIVVSGCPRSGTSLMMAILRNTFGESRIFGTDFPQKDNLDFWDTQQSGETEEQFNYRKYLQSIGKSKYRRKGMEKSMDLNPNGFWECPFTVAGIHYSPMNEAALDSLVTRTDTPILKVVSQGLAKTNPKYITKIVYMVRHPRSVAKSQERLNREMLVRKKDGTEVDLHKDLVVHSPKMFIDVSVAAMKWLSRHTEIPVHIVQFDELVDNPEGVLCGVNEFLSEPAGDWVAGQGTIDTKLRRSYPKNIKSNLWSDAEKVYRAVSSMDFGAIDFFDRNPATHTKRETRAWMCARTGLTAMEGICRACKAGSSIRKDFIEKADEIGAPWKEIPCAFDVAFNLDEPLISIEDSITNNHWLEEK